MFPHSWLRAQAALPGICQLWVSQSDLGVARAAECFIHPLFFFCLVNPFFSLPPETSAPALPGGELRSHAMTGPMLATPSAGVGSQHNGLSSINMAPSTIPCRAGSAAGAPDPAQCRVWLRGAAR